MADVVKDPVDGQAAVVPGAGGLTVGPARPPVLVTRRLPHEALDRIAARCDMTLYEGAGVMPREQLLRQVAGKAGAITLLTDRVDEEFLDAAGPRFTVVANYAVGFDNIDVPACTRHGCLACKPPGGLAGAARESRVP